MKGTMNYNDFLKTKVPRDTMQGFDPVWMPDFLFNFQKHLTEWAIRKGRAALFEDCGLGKTPQQLVWAENIRRKTKGNILIITPLAVSRQTIREGKKFKIKVHHTQEGKVHKGINVTNYARIDNYSSKDFIGVVLDESSILKNFDGKTRKKLNEFAQEIDYILLCSATPAPNDYTELGTSSEILGDMRHAQMLGMFFTHKGETTSQWTLKGHAKKRYWQWVSTWARAIRKPSDIGFENDRFILPPLKIKNHVVKSKAKNGMLLPIDAITLNEQRAERKATIKERCERVRDILPKTKICLVWCNYNDEGDYLTKIIPNAVQIKGSDKDTIKEERLMAFSDGKIRVMVTKPSIAGWGLNWQHCSNISFFPSHSYEQFYQAVRRCWRFGQKNPVNCNLISSQSEKRVLDNMMRKEKASEAMFDGIIQEMRYSQMKVEPKKERQERMKLPQWM